MIELRLPLDVRVGVVVGAISKVCTADPEAVYETLVASLVSFCMAADHSHERLEAVRLLLSQLLDEAGYRSPS